jgi:hypothetical protein
MPNIRIMNWNIEQLSYDKIRVPGMAEAIARVISGSNVDIAVLLEVKTVQSLAICSFIVAALNNSTPAPPQPYYYLLSNETGGELYGFIVRDVSLIRPLNFQPSPHAEDDPDGDGSQDRPVMDLRKFLLRTWPVAFPAAAPTPLPATRRKIPLVDLFATPDNPRPGKRAKISFPGQSSARVGYSLGRGFRLPCLALFGIRGANANYLIPLVCCHYAAVRSGRNALAQTQVEDLYMLHIAQLFKTSSEAGYLDTDLVANTGYLVQNLILTGDFNIDFLKNDATGTDLQQKNRRALKSITPTQQQGGSTTPAAAAGNPPAGPAPYVPFTDFPDPPAKKDLSDQSLRVACTADGTHLKHYDASLNPLTTAALRDAAFDNFLYGGSQVTNTTPSTGDSAQIVDLPGNIRQAGGVGAPPQIEVSGPQVYYDTKGVRDADLAPNLAGASGVAPALTIDDKWIGARLVSDHLPVILEFACP